jgi:hypothetical protein
MIFSPTTYSRLRSRLKSRYQAKLKKIIKGLKRHPYSALSWWMQEQQEQLQEYSSLNWYFLHQLETLLYFYEHPLEEHEEQEELSQVEDKVFDRWNQSEFADVFLKELNRHHSLAKASNKSLKFFEDHLLALGNRHVLKEDRVAAHYRPQLSLGERKVGGKVKRLLEATINVQGKPISLRSSSMKEMKEHSHRIESALHVITKASPSSWQRFEAFTETIIPIRIKEFVSYSHQELPGVSMINLYDRDFIDLMDDLIHENGHHHLNYYLNIGKLIEEPLEMIYYSPWRRTLRPLRGIYHAYFTFYWGYQLFSDLASSDLISLPGHRFSEKEKEKILWRAVEEFWMLQFSFEDLKWAKKHKLIHPAGWALISAQHRELLKGKKKIQSWEKKLGRYKKDLTRLKQELKTAKKNFKKN